MINVNLMVKEVLDLYFNPRCSKCRIAKSFLEKNGVGFRIIEYLDSKISREEIKDILRKGNLKAFDIIRKNEEEYKQYALKGVFSETYLINLICAHPRILQRPIISSSKKSVVARDEDILNEVKNW